jgi:hypothetical protein
MWALVQRAVASAGFTIDADHIAVLDKGQRSVKGLASGFENVVTADLVLSMQKRGTPNGYTITQAPTDFLESAIDAALDGRERDSPTHVYLCVVREYLREGYDVGAIDMAHIADHLGELGYEIDAATGSLARSSAATRADTTRSA